MSDEIEKPHFMRRNDVPQQVVKTEKIAPGRYVKGVWIPAIPVIIVRDHPGIQSIKMPDPQQNGPGKELPAMDGQTREAMKKPAQTNNTTKE